jgi:tellurite resistance protein
MMRVKKMFSKIFKREHPDVYDAVKSYAEKKNIDPADVIAAAVTAYLASDAEGKDELEKAVKSRRSSEGTGDLKPAIEMFKTMCDAMGDMFRTMNEARSSLQASSLIADYKAVTEAAQEIKKISGESGSGSLEDQIASIFLSRILGGGINIPRKKLTGKAPVETVES